MTALLSIFGWFVKDVANDEAEPDTSWFSKAEVEAINAVIRKANNSGGRWAMTDARIRADVDGIDIHSRRSTFKIELFKLSGNDPLFVVRYGKRVEHTRAFPEMIGMLSGFIQPMNELENQFGTSRVPV